MITPTLFVNSLGFHVIIVIVVVVVIVAVVWGIHQKRKFKGY